MAELIWVSWEPGPTEAAPVSWSTGVSPQVGKQSQDMLDLFYSFCFYCILNFSGFVGASLLVRLFFAPNSVCNMKRVNLAFIGCTALGRVLAHPKWAEKVDCKGTEISTKTSGPWMI